MGVWKEALRGSRRGSRSWSRRGVLKRVGSPEGSRVEVPEGGPEEGREGGVPKRVRKGSKVFAEKTSKHSKNIQKYLKSNKK